MNVLNINNVASLQKESQSALSAFEKTIVRLNGINDRIAKLYSTKQAQVASLQGELKQLNEATVQNSKVVKKITSFLED